MRVMSRHLTPLLFQYSLCSFIPYSIAHSAASIKVPPGPDLPPCPSLATPLATHTVVSCLVSTHIYLKRDREDVQVERATCHKQCPLNLFLLHTALFQFSMFEPDTKSIEHKHTLSLQRRLIITDTEGFVMALG